MLYFNNGSFLKSSTATEKARYVLTIARILLNDPLNLGQKILW
jgi:hypothetical protein